LQTRPRGIEIIFNEKSAKIKLGMIAKISIKLDENDAFFVPKRFVHFGFDGTSVLKSDDERIMVELGTEREDGQLEIFNKKLEDGMELKN
jgi:hypothetical protein